MLSKLLLRTMPTRNYNGFERNFIQIAYTVVCGPTTNSPLKHAKIYSLEIFDT